MAFEKESMTPTTGQTVPEKGDVLARFTLHRQTQTEPLNRGAPVSLGRDLYSCKAAAAAVVVAAALALSFLLGKQQHCCAV